MNDSADGRRMSVEIISRSISTKVWDRAGIELATPGSAVSLASVARHVTNWATRLGLVVVLQALINSQVPLAWSIGLSNMVILEETTCSSEKSRCTYVYTRKLLYKLHVLPSTQRV